MFAITGNNLCFIFFQSGLEIEMTWRDGMVDINVKIRFTWDLRITFCQLIFFSSFMYELFH